LLLLKEKIAKTTKHTLEEEKEKLQERILAKKAKLKAEQKEKENQTQEIEREENKRIGNSLKSKFNFRKHDARRRRI
jgi:hypothetical protein